MNELVCPPTQPSCRAATALLIGILLAAHPGAHAQRGPASCGNGLLDAGEQCDDGNDLPGDGCNDECAIEAGATCTLPTAAVTSANLVADGSFETGGGWSVTGDASFVTVEGPDLFGFPLASEGDRHLLLRASSSGGVSAIVSQSIDIPATASDLVFDWWGYGFAGTSCGAPGTGFRITLDGTTLFATGPEDCTATPVAPFWNFDVSLSIAAFADGAAHELAIAYDYVFDDFRLTNFFIDNIRLIVPLEPPLEARPSECVVAMCGDGVRATTEPCDDGDTIGGDGCAADCRLESETHACIVGDTAADVLAGALATTDYVVAGGLERDGPWTQAGTLADPLCSEARCGLAGARTGAHYAWMGGVAFDPAITPAHVQSIAQTITIGPDATTLAMYVQRDCASALDTLVASIDGVEVLRLPCDRTTLGYQEHTADIAAYADGGAHLLEITGNGLCNDFASNPACQSSFFVDDIAIVAPTPRMPAGDSCTTLPTLCRAGDTTPLLFERFDAGAPPGWTIVDTGALAGWTTTADGDYSDGRGCGGPLADWPGGNTIGTDGPAACADSNGAAAELAADSNEDGVPDCAPDDAACQVRSWLCTPPIDAYAVTGPSLSFDVDYQLRRQDASVPPAPPHETLQLVAGGSWAVPPTADRMIDYAAIGSVPDHLSTSLDLQQPVTRSVDLAQVVASEPGGDPFYVCFAYAGRWSWYAQIDNVALRANDCDAPDADGDNVPDTSDDCPGQPDVSDDDADGDGIADIVDNCTCKANPGQQDANGDAIGNACDADVTGPAGDDCRINLLDLAAFRVGFLSADLVLDLTGPGGEPDGIVNLADLNVLRTSFLGLPGPSAAGCN